MAQEFQLKAGIGFASFRVTAAAGGFELEPASNETRTRVRATDRGFELVGNPLLSGYRLERIESGRPGFVLRGADGDEAGRTTAFQKEERTPNLFYLLMGDGRMFRIGQHGARGERFELRGWETGGAYLAATPESGGWRIETTPAGTRLPEPDPLIVRSPPSFSTARSRRS